MITTNTGAKKIEGTDNWRGIFDAHNDSVDAHDQAIAKVEDGIAYRLGNTNTTGATLAVGTYVYVTGNTNSVADGMYKVSTAIAANASLTTSNLTAVPGGVANALNSNMPTATYISASTTCPNANWYCYYSFQVPQGWFCIVWTTISYNDSSPVATCISLNSNRTNLMTEEDKLRCMTIVGDTISDRTVYCWGKWSASGANIYTVKYIMVKL